MRTLIPQTAISLRANFAQMSEYTQTSDQSLYKLAQQLSVHKVNPKSIIPPKPPWRGLYETTEASIHPEASAQARVWSVGYVDPKVQTELVTLGNVWSVYVSVENWIDVRIIQTRAYHEGMPIREFVRRCWAWGWDPRVIDPFLPHGYEARVKLDQLGHDLLVEEFVCHRCARTTKEEIPKLCGCGFDYRPASQVVIPNHRNTYCGEKS